MRSQLLAILLAALLVVVLASTASAQITDGGRIGVYVDEPATGCLIQDTPGIVQAYIVQTGVTEANLSQFALEIDPSVNLTYLTGTLGSGMIALGDLFGGISLSYVGCRTSFPLTLVTLTFLGDATTTTCGAIRIVPDPSLPSGQVEVVDCSGSAHFAATANAWVNDTGDCECIYSARVCVETSAPGLQVSVDGGAYTSPHCFNWDSGTSHQVSTTTPQGPPDLTYEFVGWSDGGAMTHTIDIGDQDTTVTAIFELAPQTRFETVPSGLTVVVDGFFHTTPYDAYWAPGTSHGIRTITPQGPPDSLLSFIGWSDGGAILHTVVASNHDTTFTALFGLPTRATLDTSPPGLEVIVDGNPYTAPHDVFWTPGTSHQIAVASPQGVGSVYVFDAWSDGGAMSHNVVAGFLDTTFVASFVLASRATFETIPQGFAVEVDNTAYVAPHSLYWAPGTSHEIGTSTPQGAPDSTYQFVSWNDDGALTHGIVIGADDTTFVATFALAPRTLLESVPPGLDVIVDGFTRTTPYQAYWAPGTSHTINAPSPQGTPDSLYSFLSWSDGGAATHSIVAGAVNTTLVATFALASRATFETIPPGLTVELDSVTYATPHDQYWVPGTSHEISTASPQSPDSTYAFVGWSDGGARTHDVILGAGDTTFVATFERVTRVTLQTTPVGLDVVVDAVSYVTPHDFLWAVGTTHDVSAADSISHPQYGGLEFLGWSDGGAREHTYTTPVADTTLTAIYSVAVTGVEGEAVPSQAALKQNVPNPFNPTTHIEFFVPTPQFVELLIFDVSGSVIRRLYSGEAPEGLTTATWHGRNDRGEPVGSGVYFYQLRTRDERVTRKMVLIK